MSAMERREKRERRERLIRFIICTVLGIGAAVLIGQPNTPTTAISAILVLYIDRGYTGSIWYSWRRIRAQFLMGVVAFVLILLLRTYTPLPDWGITMLAAVLTICLGLPIQERLLIAPYSVTLGNAILIMTTGIITSPVFLLQRVEACVLGALIGHLVCYVIVPGIDRYSAVCEQLQEDEGVLMAYLRSGRWGKEAAPALKGQMAFLEKHLGYMREDNYFKHRAVEVWRVKLVSDLLRTEQHLIAFARDLSVWGRQLSPEFLELLQTNLERTAVLHQGLLDRLKEEERPSAALPAVPVPELSCKSHGEIVIAAYLVNYITYVNEANAESTAPAELQAQPAASHAGAV